MSNASSSSSTPEVKATPAAEEAPYPQLGATLAPKLARLPEGALPPEKPKEPPTQAEKRLRFWATQNGYAVKALHTHRMPDLNTYFVILEGPKDG